MTNKDKIQAALIKLGAICDDCLSSAAMVKPRQAVNQACRSLEGQKQLVRSRDVCPRCGVTKILNRYQGGNGLSSGNIKESAKPTYRPQKATSRSDRVRNHDVEALSEDEIKEVLVRWLDEDGWSSNVAWGRTPGIDIEATKGKKRWVIEAKGPGSRPQMRVNYFIGILGEMLQRMDDPGAKYSIALPDLPQYRGLWNRLPQLAKKRTDISIIFVTAGGKIEHEN